jgi:hypothetical protein
MPHFSKVKKASMLVDFKTAPVKKEKKTGKRVANSIRSHFQLGRPSRPYKPEVSFDVTLEGANFKVDLTRPSAVVSVDEAFRFWFQEIEQNIILPTVLARSKELLGKHLKDIAAVRAVYNSPLRASDMYGPQLSFKIPTTGRFKCKIINDSDDTQTDLHLLKPGRPLTLVLTFNSLWVVSNRIGLQITAKQLTAYPYTTPDIELDDASSASEGGMVILDDNSSDDEQAPKKLKSSIPSFDNLYESLCMANQDGEPIQMAEAWRSIHKGDLSSREKKRLASFVKKLETGCENAQARWKQVQELLAMN